MEDPALNRTLEEARELQTRWSQFHDFCLMAMKGQAVSAQAEMKFLELKSRIAMLHDSFMDGLKHSHKTGQNVMQILSDSILLKRVANYSEAERQKFEFDWNEAYLLINEQISSLQEEQKRLAVINQRTYRAGKSKELVEAWFYNLLHGAGLKYTVITVIAVMLLYVVPAYIWSYRNFGGFKPTKPAYDKVVRYLWRPIFDHDYEFESMDEVPYDTKYTIPERINETSNASLTASNFKSTVLLEIGQTDANKAELQSLFDRNKAFRTRRFTAEGEDGRFFSILFPSSADARKFVDLCHAGVATYPAARQQTIRDQIYLRREANLVMIGISKHIQYKLYIEQYYLLKNDPPSLLN